MASSPYPQDHLAYEFCAAAELRALHVTRAAGTEVVGHLGSRVVLVDGPTLAGLMLDHNVGVSSTASYEIKKIDTDSSRKSEAGVDNVTIIRQ